MKSVSPRPDQEALMVRLMAKPEKFEELHQALEGLVPEISLQPGCLEAKLSWEAFGGSRFLLLYMGWRDAEAVFRHLASEEFRILLGAVRLLSVTVEFESNSAKSVQVLDAVRKVQGATASGRSFCAEFQP